MYIISIESVTSLYSSQFIGTFLPAIGPMPKKEEFLRNWGFCCGTLASWPMLQSPNPSCSLFLHFIYLDKSNKNIPEHPFMSLPWFQRQNNSYQDKQPKAMKKLSPSQSHKNQVTGSTHNHLSKAANQHPPPSFSLARIKSKAPPTATTSAKE